MNFNIVFMGTPDFAVPSLEMLVENGYCVKACVTQPDRKAGRGHKMVPPPVKEIAQKHGIEVLQFHKISSEDGVRELRRLQPDLLITAAFGQILSEEVLKIPQYGCINVHASLLPKYRGSAPINWAIIKGEDVTGITTMYTVKQLDAGDILEQDSVDIPPQMTAGELYDVLRGLGAKTLKRTLEKLRNGTLIRTPQIEEDATYDPMFKKGFGEIEFHNTCADIHNFVRGTTPSPGAFVWYEEEKIRVCRVSKYSDEVTAKIGELMAADEKQGILVQARDGVLALEQIKRPGGKWMDAKDSMRGRPLRQGYVFPAAQNMQAGEQI